MGLGEGAVVWGGFGLCWGSEVVFIRDADGVWGGGCGVGWASWVWFVMGVRGGFYKGC